MDELIIIMYDLFTVLCEQGFVFLGGELEEESRGLRVRLSTTSTTGFCHFHPR